MSTSGTLRGALAGAVLLVGTLAALPAHAAPAESAYTGWVHREDGSASGSDGVYELSGGNAVLGANAWDGQVAVYNAGDGVDIGANFVPPAGQTLRAGQTYRADVSQDDPSSKAGRLMVWRDSTMCGKTEEQLFAGYFGDSSSPEFAPATGWFHISELEYDVNGKVTRFAATYEINCQFVGGPPGFEGSVAVNSSLPPVSVPDAPVPPGPVSDLKVTNVGPNGSGDNSTTLTWTNPQGSGDVDVEMVQSSDRSKMPALLGTYPSLPYNQHLYRGRAGRYHEDHIGFMDTRTYRVVARGASGRLGPSTFVTVLGTRLSLPEPKHTIMIGQTVTDSGRLSESWDYVDPADVMKGRGLVGRTVVLCEQSYINYVDGECTPVDRTTTTADGRFTLSATPKENSLYTVVVPATSGMIGNTDPLLITQVAPQTDLRAPQSPEVSARVSELRRGGAWVVVHHGSVIKFTTSRARRGSRGFIRLQRLDGTKWRTIVTKRLVRGSASGRLAVPYREFRRGRHAYRVVKPGDAHHVNGYSRTVHIRVR